jgi:hypothetical protein
MTIITGRPKSRFLPAPSTLNPAAVFPAFFWTASLQIVFSKLVHLTTRVQPFYMVGLEFSQIFGAIWLIDLFNKKIYVTKAIERQRRAINQDKGG